MGSSYEVVRRHDGFDTVRFDDGTFGYRTARGEVRGGFRSPSGATLSAKRAIAKAGTEALSSPDPATVRADEELRRWADRVREVYGRAESEMRAKQASAMERYEEEREAWEGRVRSGEATREEFDEWLRNQASVQGWMIGLTDQLSRTFADADAEAVRMVSEGGHLAGAYAEGMNYATYQVESGAGASTSFTLYDRATVEALMREGMQPLPEPSTDGARDLAWNRRKIVGEVTQGILQGESADAVANRLRGVLGMDRRAATRAARTALTGAQNAGRVDAYARAKAMGIGLRQEWQATYDARTRHTHAALDGEVIELGEAFSNGLRYPGDPEGPPSEVYNCRCTLVPILGGLDDGAWKKDLKVGDETYDQWKERHADAAGLAPHRGETATVLTVEQTHKAIDALPGVDFLGREVKSSPEDPSRLARNPVPYVGDEEAERVMEAYRKAKGDGADRTLEEVAVDALVSTQSGIYRRNAHDILDLMGGGTSQFESKTGGVDYVELFEFEGRMYVIDGNHRCAILKLRGFRDVVAMVTRGT